MRNGEGRPSPGMRPDVILEDGKEVASSVTLLLVPELLQDSIRQFRYMAMKVVYFSGWIHFQSSLFP